MVDMLEGREAGEEGAQFDSLHEALAQPGHRQLPGLPHQLGDEAVVPLHRWEEVWGLVPTQAILERIWWRLKKYTKYRNSGRPLYKLYLLVFLNEFGFGSKIFAPIWKLEPFPDPCLFIYRYQF